MSGDDLTAGEEKVNASERASYVPTWYTASMVPASARGPLTFDLDVDVCVVGAGLAGLTAARRSEEHTSELQSRQYLVCRLLLEKKKKKKRRKQIIDKA